MDNHSSLVYTYPDIVKRIHTPVYVYTTYLNQDLSDSHKHIAVWDTGATITGISENIVDKYHLLPLSTSSTSTPGGEIESPVYVIDLVLPGKIMNTTVLARGLHLTDCDLLIGMDIISLGDFSISNRDGKTKFTFQVYDRKD